MAAATALPSGFPVAQGLPSHHGIYNPMIWASKLLVKFYQGCCLAEVSNTDYEGDIKDQGDSVRIRITPDISTFAYTKGGGIPVQTPTPTHIDLSIDKGRGFAYAVNPVDVKQADMKFVDQWATDASEQMKIAIERAVYADIYGDASAYNIGSTAGQLSSGYNLGVAGTPLALTKSNVLDAIIDAGSALSEQDIPEEDRFAIIPVWMANLIKKSDLKDVSMTGDGTSSIRTGRIGRLDGMTLYRSNLLTSVTDAADSNSTCWNVMVGHRCALTFATQLVHNEVVPNANDYGNVHRGLQVYGYKVVKPEGLSIVYAKKAA